MGLFGIDCDTSNVEKKGGLSVLFAFAFRHHLATSADSYLGFFHGLLPFFSTNITPFARLAPSTH